MQHHFPRKTTITGPDARGRTDAFCEHCQQRVYLVDGLYWRLARDGSKRCGAVATDPRVTGAAAVMP